MLPPNFERPAPKLAFRFLTTYTQSKMNWTYIISAAAVEVALLTLVYHLTARRRDATLRA